MKTLFKIAATLTLSFFLISALCIGIGMPDITPIVFGLSIIGALATPQGAGILCVGISATQLAAELGAYFRANNKEIKQMVYQDTVTSKYMRSVSKVKGRFPAPHSITSRVIQGFTTTWAELGTTYMKANELINYHQKINFPIVPADILGTWLAELYAEDKKAVDMPISQYIVQKELPLAINRDLEYLWGQGVYDANDLGTFGKSMNGLVKILADGIASSDKPMYKIPLDALTDSNISSQVEKFEASFPQALFNEDMDIYMSTVNAYRYKRDVRNTFGLNTDYNTAFQTKSNLTGRNIVGLPSMNGSNVIFATPRGNMLRLIDIFDKPQVTDVQVADYKVKVFMEWWDGIGFWMNQLVLVSVDNGSGSGLATDNSIYYAE